MLDKETVIKRVKWGQPVATIAQDFGVTRAAVYALLQSQEYKVDQLAKQRKATEKTVLRLHKQGLCNQRIWKQAHISLSVIKRVLKEHNLEPNPREHKQEGPRKLCIDCKQEKILDEFYLRSGRSGHMSYCKECFSNRISWSHEIRTEGRGG